MLSAGIQKTRLIESCDCRVENYTGLKHVVMESENGYDVKCLRKSDLIARNTENDTEVRLLKLYIHLEPEIAMVFNILNEEWIDHLLERSKSKWAFSQTSRGALSGDPDTYETSVSKTRRSMSAIFEYAETETIAKIEHRVASIANIDVSHLEKLVMVKYKPGDYFKEHHDGAFRSATILLYINDVDGGETVFPRLNLAIKPVENAGVLWRNVRRDLEPDMRMIHAGTTPKKGEKYVVNCFFNVQPIRLL